MGLNFFSTNNLVADKGNPIGAKVLDGKGDSMGDKGKKDKGKREEQKKSMQTPKEKRKQKKIKK